MIRAISRQKDTERQKLTGATKPLLPPKELSLCDNLYPRNLAILIVFTLTFLDIVSLDAFFWIPIRLTM